MSAHSSIRRWLALALVWIALSCSLLHHKKDIAPPSSSPAKTASPLQPVVEFVAPFTAGVHGMALRSDGTLFFSDSFGKRDKVRRIYTLAPPYNGEPQPTSITGATPAGLTFIDGLLYVCDVGAGTVTSYNASLSATATWNINAPWNVVHHPSLGLVSVTYDGRVVKLEADGNVTEVFSGGLAPFALAVDPKGGLWMSEQGAAQGDPGRITRREANGSAPKEIAYPWANPEGLGVGADGLVWIAETERGELLRITADDRVEVIKTGLTLPVVIAVTPNGELFVSTGGASPGLFRVLFIQKEP